MVAPDKLRFIKNRDAILQSAHERHQLYLNIFKFYKPLVKARKDVDNAKKSIELYRTKLQILYKRLYKLNRKKEELEIKFGKERGEWKRANPNRSDRIQSARIFAARTGGN